MIRIRAAKRKERTSRDTVIVLRTSAEDRMRAEAIKNAMQLSSRSEVFRTLLNEKADELGVV